MRRGITWPPECEIFQRSTKSDPRHLWRKQVIWLPHLREPYNQPWSACTNTRGRIIRLADFVITIRSRKLASQRLLASKGRNEVISWHRPDSEAWSQPRGDCRGRRAENNYLLPSEWQAPQKNYLGSCGRSICQRSEGRNKIISFEVTHSNKKSVKKRFQERRKTQERIQLSDLKKDKESQIIGPEAFPRVKKGRKGGNTTIWLRCDKEWKKINPTAFTRLEKGREGGKTAIWLRSNDKEKEIRPQKHS